MGCFSCFLVVCSQLSFAEFYRFDIFVVSLQQKGDEGEEGVTSEGRTISCCLFFPPVDFLLCFSYIFIASSLKFISFAPLLPEFDKFLEERAKAAEMAPSLPTPPSGNPAAPQGTPSRKKPDRPEDSLFAM